MTSKVRKLIASWLLFVNLFQSVFAALPPSYFKAPSAPIGNKQAPFSETQQVINKTTPDNLALSTKQLNLPGPLNAGINYSDLTGTYFNGQFLKAINDKAAFNLLGEYGDKQYRINGTVGLILAAQTFFKVSAEQLGQKLPFYFTTGTVDKQVKQNAVGARLQRNFNDSILDNLSLGAYAAKAPNYRLDPVRFVSNGSNCNGFSSGLVCLTERNIAGASSSGSDLGMGTYLTRNTYLEGRVYYDTVHYNTIFSYQSVYNRSGLGGGLYGQQLLASNVKLSAGAEIREIYNTYNLALSWMPTLAHASGTELSLMAQRVVSHNQTPNNNTISLQVTFFADKINTEVPVYGLTSAPIVDNIASWVSQPAVKMNQVLAISEEYTHLDETRIEGIYPNSGPLGGGNLVTITGTNFLPGAMVLFGTNMATVTSMTSTSLTVIAPTGNALGAVPVTITTPDGKTTTLDNGYLYSNGISPLTTGSNPLVGPTAGGTTLTINGANFQYNNTTVTIGGIEIPAASVTVNSPTSLTVTTPAHPAGTVMVTVTTPGGTSNPLPGGYTYVDAPTVTSLTPTAGVTAGGTLVTISGTSFVIGNTSVTIDGTVIPAGSVTVQSSTSLTFATPAHAAGTVAVSVNTPGGASGAVPGGYTYDDASATVSSLSPVFGPSAGGTSVTITGTDFVPGNTSVTIGGLVVPAGSVTVNSSTSLTFTTPAHAQGVVSVSVTTPVGTSGVVPGGFTYEDAPTVTSLSPQSGSTTGGLLVTISGSNFVSGDTSVTIGGIVIPAASVSVNSATSLTFSTPAHAAGNVSVSVSTSGGTSSTVPGGFTYEDAPTATSLSPTFGSSAGGTSVTITGSNFVVGDTSVTIGGILIPAASVTVNSATSLTFSTPAHAAGNVSVNVSTAGGSSSSIPGGFTYENAPTATSLSPAFGSSAGGTVVTITGSNFSAGNTSVTIGGTVIPAASVTVNSASSLTFSTPAHAAGNVSVSVSTSGGTSSSIPGGFTYEDAPTATSLSPAFGSSAGGTAVTIAGSNFVAGDTSVTIGGTVIPAASVTVNSATSLTFSTPAHAAGNVSVSVSTSGGASSSVPGGFTYENAPTATSLSPAFGSSAGGTSVTIAGSNFVVGNTSVTIGGTVIPAASVTVNSATSLTFSTPAHAAGNVSVSVSTSGGTSSTVPGGFTYENAPTATSLSPAFGSSAGGTSVTIAGSNFVVGDTSVTIGGTVVPAASVTVNSATSLTFSTPAHAAGNVSVSVSTSGGTSSSVPGGFTYEDAPTATSLSPAFGSSAGGTLVTIAGSNFVTGNTSVTIGGTVIPAASVMVNSATSLTFSTPAHAAGNVSVSVSTSGGTSSSVPGGFTYEDAPTVTSLSPAFGSSAGGTSVTIAGSNFVVGDTSVTIGGTVIPSGSVTVNSATSLTFSTPAHAAGNVSVSVSTSGGTSSTVPGGFTYEDAPTATSLSPAFGSSAGGTSVTIAGSNFVVGDTSVTIGGTVIPAASVMVNSATSLSFSTPAHAAGNVSVSVSTSGGTSSTVPGGFTYEDAPTATSLSPAFGSSAGGTSVTIAGSNFVAGDTSVTIGGTVVPAASVTVNSATSLTFSTPAHAAGNVSVSVSTSGGTSSSVPGGFTYEDAPTVTSLNPPSGPTIGGSLVTITGANFVSGDTSVTIGGLFIPAGSVTVNSASSLTFVTPTHAAGNVAVTVTTSGGTSGAVPGGYTYNDTSPTLTSLSPAFGPIAGGTSVTLTGTNFLAGNTSVTIGGTIVPVGSVTVNSPTSLTFVTPAHAAGNVAVTVTTPVGTSGFVPGGFTYEASPTATSLTPTAGSIVGGTSVTVTGSNFVSGDTSVTIGGIVIPTGSVTVNSANSLTFSTPAHAAGNVTVTVTTSGGTSGAVPGGYTYDDNSATVTSLSPAFGPIAGGTSVTLTGTNFLAGNTSVTIGGITVPVGSVTVNSSTSLTFSTPAHAAGNVAVSVTTPVGTSGFVPGGFTYEDAPTAISLNPIFGSIAGGTSVTITGTNFVSGDTSVTIGGTVIPAGSVTVNSASSLTFSTPAHAAGNVAVTVATSGGISSSVPGGFTYEDVPTATSLSPAFGPIAGGTLVTITGTNFVSGDTSVTIGGIVIPAGSVTVNSATSLSFSTPAHAAGNVGVIVATSGGGSANVPGGFTYEDLPTATSLTPTAGPIAGGTVVTITGTNFVWGNTSVTIGGVVIPAGSVTVNSATSLSFSTPAHAAGNVAVTVATSGGVSSSVPGGFIYEDVPTATSLSPVFGPIAGGTLVTIAGTNFVSGDTSVTIGGVTIPAGSVTVNSATSLSFSTPAHAAGNVAVSVTTSGGSSANVSGGFTYVAAPTATSLTPIAGPIAGGTVVTITGTNFVSGDTSVTIGGTVVSSGSVTVNSATSLSFSTPAHAAGNVAVSVTTSGGSSANVSGGFTYVAVPTATSLAPIAGPIAGGTLVTITGTNFISGDTSVTIGGTVIPSGSVTVNSATSLSFSTPAHAAGNVGVSVTTSGGSSANVSGGFTYVAAPTAASLTPTAGPIAGGTVVTITGTNFVSGDTSVTIGGTVIPAGSVTVNSATSLSFSTPAHAAGNVAVSVTTSGGSSANVSGGFTYEDIPTATSLTPTAGPIAGGTVVTITGTNFVSGDTSVTIGGTVIPAGSVTVNSATSLSFSTPAHAAGNVGVSVATSGGSSANVSGGFTYVAIPTAASLTPTAGPIAGGTVVTITGTNFVSGDTSVTIGGTVIPAGSVTVNSATSLSFSTPAHAAGNVAVSVTTSGGSSANVSGGFTYVAAPTAASLTPTSGTTAGGTAVTVTGTNFVSAATSVTIGGTVVPAASVTVSSATSLTFSTPTHAAGNVAVSVTTPGGTSANISGGYTYLAPSLASCSAPIPSLLGIQLLTCVGANLTLFETTFLKASGSAACSTFPTQSVVPSINLLGNVVVTATNIPGILTQGLIGCNIQLCSNSSCSILNGVAGPVTVTLGL